MEPIPQPRVYKTTDPVERVIEDALLDIGAIYQAGHEVPNNLDFYLPHAGIYIECKRFNTDWIAGQMARVPDIIVVQGMKAAILLATLIKGAGILTRIEIQHG